MIGRNIQHIHHLTLQNNDTSLAKRMSLDGDAEKKQQQLLNEQVNESISAFSVNQCILTCNMTKTFFSSLSRLRRER